MSTTADDPVLAAPPGDCCTQGFIHSGEPKGEMITVAGVGTYITRPPPPPSPSGAQNQSPSRILLYFPDVWGIDGSFQFNGKLLMDYFASQGFLVLGIDYFQGDPVQKHRKSRTDTTTEPGFDFEAWKRKHRAFADENVPKWTDQVARQFGSDDTKYATVGYCFGAPFVMNSLQSSTFITVGAIAHPAFLNESHFQNCTKPLFLSCAQTDHTFSVSARHRAEEILSSDNTTTNHWHFQLFSNVEHGFALRGNMDDPYERWVKEESAASIVRWFKHFM